MMAVGPRRLCHALAPAFLIVIAGLRHVPVTEKWGWRRQLAARRG